MAHETLLLTDPSRGDLRGTGDRPVRAHVRRTSRGAAPLVVLSHGTGGAAEDLGWWAQALCDEGFDVVAIDHHGNSYVDGYVAEAFVRWWDRPLDVSVVLDHLEPHGPVGAAGFSIGGYTAAALCGARVDAAGFHALMTGVVPDPPTPEYPGLREELLRRHGRDGMVRWVDEAAGDCRDPRVGAAFLLCPAVGPLISEASLRSVDVPVAVRWTEADESTPAHENGMRYAALIPGAQGAAVGAPTSGHYGFVLPDVEDLGAKADVIRDSVEFFDATLRHGTDAGPGAQASGGRS